MMVRLAEVDMRWWQFKTWDSVSKRHVNIDGQYQPLPDLAFSASFLTASAVRRHPGQAIVFRLPQCCIEELIVSPSERIILGFLHSGEGECGYEVFKSGDTIERTSLGPLFRQKVMLSPPAISPDERFIVSATGNNDPLWRGKQEALIM
jgi:hypothetical protein